MAFIWQLRTLSAKNVASAMAVQQRNKKSSITKDPVMSKRNGPLMTKRKRKIVIEIAIDDNDVGANSNNISLLNKNFRRCAYDEVTWMRPSKWFEKL